MSDDIQHKYERHWYRLWRKERDKLMLPYKLSGVSNDNTHKLVLARLISVQFTKARDIVTERLGYMPIKERGRK